MIYIYFFKMYINDLFEYVTENYRTRVMFLIHETKMIDSNKYKWFQSRAHRYPEYVRIQNQLFLCPLEIYANPEDIAIKGIY